MKCLIQYAGVISLSFFAIDVSSLQGATIILDPAQQVGLNQLGTSTTYPNFLGSIGGETWRAYFKFELPPEIGGASNITSAVFSVAARNPLEDPLAYGVMEYIADDSWDAGTLNWTNKPTSVNAGDVPMSSSAWHIAPSGNLASLLAAGDGTISLALRGNIEDAAQMHYNNISLAPENVYLTIEYVPEPGMLSVLGTSLLLGARRRRRQ